MSKKTVINISSLISELKVEVHQCGCCMNSNQSQQWIETLKNQVSESLLEAISIVKDNA